MGRVSPAYSGDRPLAAYRGLADPPDRLCRNGAVAGMVGGHLHRGRNPHAQQAIPSQSQRHLSNLLAAIDERPDILASRLLHRFGSIGRIAHASAIELRQLAKAEDNWVSAFIAVRQLIYDGMREELVRTPIGQNREALENYLLMTMQHLPEERMLAIFADANGNVITEEVIAEGCGGLVHVTPRRVFGRALNLDARRIILAHNHPSGNPEPSVDDIKHTRQLDAQAVMLGLTIDDHLVIGARRITSMKNRGLY